MHGTPTTARAATVGPDHDHGPDPARRRARRQATATVVAVGGAAWALLAAWGASPWGRYLDHDDVAGAGLPAGGTVAVFVGGWVLMLAAVMFPTTWSLLEVFAPLAERRGARRRLVGLLVVGYLAAWTAAGSVLLAGDLVIHRVVDEVAWLSRHPSSVTVATLAAAGAFQLSPLKDRCLTVCRSPRAFVFTRWQGRAPATEALLLGVAHGRFCIGCCIGLMLVSFGIGAGNLGLMLAFGTVMAAEKLAPGGSRLATPVGVALLAAAVAVAAS